MAHITNSPVKDPPDFLGDYESDEEGYRLSIGRLLQLIQNRVGSKRRVDRKFSISRGTQDALEKGQTLRPANITFIRLTEALQQFKDAGDPLVDPEDPLSRPIDLTVKQLKKLWTLSRNEEFKEDDEETLAEVKPTLEERICELTQQTQEFLDRTMPDESVLLFVMAVPTSKAPTVLAEVNRSMGELFAEYTTCANQDVRSISEEPEEEDADQHFPPALTSDQINELEFQFKNNSAAMLATLVNLYQSEHGDATLEEVGRTMARLVNPDSGYKETQRFTRMLEDLQNNMSVPEDDRDCLQFLSTLARMLRPFEGETFGGDVEELLDYIGC